MLWHVKTRLLFYSVNSWVVLLAAIHLPGAVLISNDLEVTLTLLQMSIGVYLLTYALFQVSLVVFFGVQRPLLAIFAGGVAAIIGCFVCGIADNIESFFIGRIFQAGGAATCVISIRICARSYFPESSASQFLAQMFVFTSIVLLVGPIISGILATFSGWHSIFYALASWGCINLIFFSRVLLQSNSHSPPSNELDLSRANFVSFIACTVNPKIAVFAIYNAVCYWGFYGYLSGMPVVADGQASALPEIVAILSAFSGLGAIVGGVIAARLARRLNAYTIIGVGFAISLITIVLVLTPFLMSTNMLVIELGVLGFLVGSTLGLVQPNALLCAMSIKDINVPSAAAVVGCTQIISGSIASFAMPLLVGSMVQFVVGLSIFSWGVFLFWLFAVRRGRQK
jgi:DHA1 family bicyclomycin/chloramphenicol resistance-like MFS transporter